MKFYKSRANTVIVILTVTVFFVFSCSKQELKYKLQKNDFITFKNNLRKGFLKELYVEGHNYYAIYDLETEKKAFIYNQNGKIVSAFNLEKLSKSLVSNGVLSFIDLKTVLCFEYQTGILYKVNKTGKILDFKNFSNIIKSENGYELYPNFLKGKFIFNKNDLLFYISYSLPEKFNNLNNLEYTESFGKYNSKKEGFIRIKNPFSKSPKVEKLNVNLSRFFLKKGKSVSDFPTFFLKNDSLVLSSYYSDKIYIYSLTKKKIIFTKKLTSTKGKIGMKQLNIDSDLFEKQSRYFYENLKISSIDYDERNKKYFILLTKHVVSKKTTIRPLIILDDKFNQVLEINLNDENFDLYYLFKYKKNDYILYNTKINEKDKTKIVFNKFSLI